MKCIIDDVVAVDMLMERVEYWTGDFTINNLFRKMYERLVDSGVFEDREFDTMYIVDNDYINWCTIYEQGDDEYEEILETFNKGEFEVGSLGTIEAE
jgi:hypothetical protein